MQTNSQNDYYNKMKQFSVDFADALVLKEALLSNPSAGGASLELLAIDLENMELRALLTWHAMNDVGYYVGYESCVLSWKLFDKSDVGAMAGGLPYSMSPFCTALDSYTISQKQYPLEESEWEDAGYYPALEDDDFIWQEVDSLLREAINNIRISFDRESRTWHIDHANGGLTWPVDGQVTWKDLYNR